eukprot:gene38268-46501_t
MSSNPSAPKSPRPKDNSQAAKPSPRKRKNLVNNSAKNKEASKPLDQDSDTPAEEQANSAREDRRSSIDALIRDIEARDKSAPPSPSSPLRAPRAASPTYRKRLQYVEAQYKHVKQQLIEQMRLRKHEEEVFTQTLFKERSRRNASLAQQAAQLAQAREAAALCADYISAIHAQFCLVSRAGGGGDQEKL